MGLLIALALLVIGASLGSAQPSTSGLPPSEEGIIVRVHFDDPVTARRLAIWLEPLESKYEKGYLVLEVSPEEYRRLLAAGLRVEVDEARKAQIAGAVRAVPPGATAIPGFPCYRTVEETYASAKAIADAHPNLATWTDAGNSWEKSQGLGGYDMMVLRLTNSAIPGTKPKIFITAAIHAREYTTAELVMRLAEKLVNGYGTDADITYLLDFQEVHMMFHTNPDGRKKAETGLLWRKNTNRNYCGSTSSSRGADLNRNFAFHWNCCGGSSTWACAEDYHGPFAASEPETQAVQNYLMAQFPDRRGPSLTDPVPTDASGIYLDIHSSGRLLLWPWGFTDDPAPNGAQLQTLGRKLAFFNGHHPEQAIGLYPTDGTTDDFAYGELGLAAFTYELGTEFFESCSYFENTILPDNLPSLLYVLKAARAPYLMPAGPEALNLTLNAGGTEPGVPAGTLVTLRAMIDDTRYNNSNGTEPTQNISAAEYYLDLPPWDNPSQARAMLPVDGGFNGKTEIVEAAIDTTGLNEGKHILYVRGKDAGGNWGVYSAAFLYIKGKLGTVASVSAASYDGSALPPESIVAAFGTSLSDRTETAQSIPLPTILAGTTVKVRDNAGAERLAPLFYVSPLQVNYQMPAGTAAGQARVTVTHETTGTSTGSVVINPVAPGIFSANADGKGVAAAQALRVKTDGSQAYEPVARYDEGQKKFVAVPIDLGPAGDQVYLILYATGLRYRSGLAAVSAKIGGVDAPVSYAGAQGYYVGLDQVNLLIPRSLAGRGEVNVELAVEGKKANPVTVTMR
jgi:uncharacterized protein (TIGR03437 family)